MITAKELNPKNYLVTAEQAGNLADLLFKINIIRREWGKPMIVTSGLRSKEDQMRINPKAPNSKHLLGAAVDISDPDGSLYHWLTEHTARLKQIGLYCELGTKGWCHIQVLPPASGNTWFLP